MRNKTTKKSPLKIALRAMLGVLSLFLIYVVGVIGYGMATDWQPKGQTPLAPDQSAAVPVVTDSVLSFVIWNVGYAGLGASSDFFYDDEGMWHAGSSMVHSPKSLVDQYQQGILQFVKNTQADFWLLQEVDVESDRSHRLPQYRQLCETLPGYAATMSANYQCRRVPIPILQPWRAYGKVLSGLGTFSKYQPKEAVRHQLPGVFPLPKRIFELDRCVAVHRYPTLRGPELVAINVHHSAYDPGDKVKVQQMAYLKELALAEYQRGNYVVIGGDWNICAPNFPFKTLAPGIKIPYELGNVPADYFPEDWVFAYDPTTPTNRSAANIYKKGETFVTVIDYFLVSPNVQVQSVKGVDVDFQYSDHQPVRLTVRLL